MNRQRFLLVLALMAIATLVNGAKTNQVLATQATPARQVADRILESEPVPPEFPAPIRIFNLKVDGKEISFDQKFAADEEWARSLSFDIKNISGKVLTRIQFSLGLRGSKGNASAPLFFYGSDTLQPGVEPAVRVMPGEVIHVEYNDKYYNVFKMARDRAGLTSVNAANFCIDALVFDDDTMWRHGAYLRRDSSDPHRWNVIK